MSDETYPSPGSATSPPESPKNQIDFQFLNFSHPSDAKASRARKTVRSHVTRQQHAREHERQAVRKAESYQGTSSEPQQPPTSTRRHADTFPTERPTTNELLGTTGLIAPLTSSPEASSPSPSPTASPNYLSQRRIDPTEIYPEEWHLYIPRVMVGFI